MPSDAKKRRDQKKKEAAKRGGKKPPASSEAQNGTPEKSTANGVKGKDGKQCSLTNDIIFIFGHLLYTLTSHMHDDVIFPVAKLKTQRFVAFINITSRFTYILVTN